jgi:hypothetical protein
LIHINQHQRIDPVPEVYVRLARSYGAQRHGAAAVPLLTAANTDLDMHQGDHPGIGIVFCVLPLQISESY